MGSARLQICPRHTMIMKTSLNHIPDRSQPGSKMTAPPAVHHDGGVKYATGAPTKKIRGKNDITIGTWKVRTLRAAGKLKELTHEMERYRWNLLGLAEMRWKSFGETSTEGGHKVYFSGKKDKHEQGVGFLVHKDIVNTVMGCRPISSRLITIRLKATPFNMTVIQVYATTSDYDDSEVEDFYGQLQEVIEETPKERQSYCTRRLECKSGKGCAEQLARHLRTFLQRGNKWERSQAPRICNVQ